MLTNSISFAAWDVYFSVFSGTSSQTLPNTVRLYLRTWRVPALISSFWSIPTSWYCFNAYAFLKANQVWNIFFRFFWHFCIWIWLSITALTGRRAFPRKTSLSCQNFMTSKQNGHSLKDMPSESIMGIIHCKFKTSVSAPKGRFSSMALKLFWPFVGPFCQMGFYIDPNKNHFCPTKHQFNRLHLHVPSIYCQFHQACLPYQQGTKKNCKW